MVFFSEKLSRLSFGSGDRGRVAGKLDKSGSSNCTAPGDKIREDKPGNVTH